tara:strand:- start:21 stop:260 length:240 start_codon:yes stop_codon:yes gene_type:complete
MYFIIMAAMVTSITAAPLPMPSVMASFSTLEKCRANLIYVAKNDGFKLVKHPMFGKSAVKQYGNEGLALFFCARDMRQI